MEEFTELVERLEAHSDQSGNSLQIHQVDFDTFCLFLEHKEVLNDQDFDKTDQAFIK